MNFALSNVSPITFPANVLAVSPPSKILRANCVLIRNYNHVYPHFVWHSLTSIYEPSNSDVTQILFPSMMTDDEKDVYLAGRRQYLVGAHFFEIVAKVVFHYVDIKLKYWPRRASTEIRVISDERCSENIYYCVYESDCSNWLNLLKHVGAFANSLENIYKTMVKDGHLNPCVLEHLPK